MNAVKILCRAHLDMNIIFPFVPSRGSCRLDTFLHSIPSIVNFVQINHSSNIPNTVHPSLSRASSAPYSWFPAPLFTCQYHLSLHSRILSLSSTTFNSCLILSLLILSRLVTLYPYRQHIFGLASWYILLGIFQRKFVICYLIYRYDRFADFTLWSN